MSKKSLKMTFKGGWDLISGKGFRVAIEETNAFQVGARGVISADPSDLLKLPAVQRQASAARRALKR